MGASFPVQYRRALPTLGVFALIGVLVAAAALINVSVTDAEAKQPWALTGLVLGLPGIWVVIVVSHAAFSLRITDENIEKLFVNRWVVASGQPGDLRSASIAQNTLQLTFMDGSAIRLAAMPLRDRALLARVLAARCPDVQLSR